MGRNADATRGDVLLGDAGINCLHAGIDSLRENAYVKGQQFESSLRYITGELDGLRKELQNLKVDYRSSAGARPDAHSSLARRVDALEKTLAESSAKQLDALVAAHKSPRESSLLELREMLDRRMLNMEQRLSDVACELAGTKQRIGDVADRASRLASEAETAQRSFQSLEDRQRDLQGLVNDEISHRSMSRHGGTAQLGHCTCGNAFMPDSNFCRKCGAKRASPSTAELELSELVDRRLCAELKEQQALVLKRLTRVEQDISRVSAEQIESAQVLPKACDRQDVNDLRRRLCALEASSPLQADRAQWEEELLKTQSRVKEESEARLLDCAALAKRLAFVEERACRWAGLHARQVQMATSMAEEQTQRSARVNAIVLRAEGGQVSYD